MTYRRVYATRYESYRKALAKRQPRMVAQLDKFESELARCVSDGRHGRDVSPIGKKYGIKRLKSQKSPTFEAAPFGRTFDIRVIWMVDHEVLILTLINAVSHKEL